jgi:phage-related protein
MGSKTLNTILSLQDKTSSKLVKVSSNFKGLSKEAQRATLQAQKSLNRLGTSIEKTVTKAAKLGTGLAATLGTMAIGKGLSEGLDLEGYRVQLETATKSTEKAAEIMKYSIDLANKTPFEGGAMVEASAKLESMGLSAKSYLSNIVDMAAATNKPLDQATEAFIDAQTGELERLKEFGLKKADIQARANELFAGQETINSKGQIVNQENFNKALLSLMEERYDGGAEKLAKTTKGMWSTVTGITKSALAKIVGVQEDGTIKSGTLLEKVKSQVQSLADKLTEWQSNGTLDNIASKFTEVFGKVYEIVSNVINFIVEHKDIIITIASMAVAFTVVSKAVRGVSIAIQVFKVAWAILNGTILLSPIGWVILGITALVGLFVLLWTKCEGFRKIVISIGQSVITWFGNTIMPIIQKIWTSLQNLWNNVLLPFATWLLKVLAPVFTIIWEYVKNAFNGIGLVIQGALEIFNGIIDFITGVFTGNWGQAWEGVKTIFKGIFDSLKGIAKAPLNFIIDIVNKCIDGINKIDFNIPDWVPVLGGEHVGLNIPHIPQLATGTQYFNGGPVRMNEYGNGEMAVLPSGSKVIPAGQTNKILNDKKEINININFDTFIGEESFANRCGEIMANKIKLALANM